VFRFSPYVLKNLWRHRTRSLLTVSGAAVALLVFCFVAAVQDGLDEVVRDPRAERTLVVFQENRFCPTTSRLPQDYARRIAKLGGVSDVVPLQVYTNNCRASLDVIVFHGLPAEKLRSARELHLVAGDWAEFEGRRDAALVGAAVAARRKIAVGRQFSIGEVSVHVAGIFASPSPADENLIYTHLEFLQRAQGAGTVGQVTQLEVHVTDGADPGAVAGAIDDAFHAGPVATTTRRKGVFLLSTLADVIDLVRFARWLGYACIGLVLSLVATTTVMAVQDRVRQHALLETLGMRPGRLFRLIVSESLLVCLVGGILGTGLALAALGWGGLGVGVEGITFAFRPSPALGLTGLGISALVGLLAGIFPAWQATRTRIVDALRNG
jgi:putative ABC transport system permease protein